MILDYQSHDLLIKLHAKFIFGTYGAYCMYHISCLSGQLGMGTEVLLQLMQVGR